MYEYLQVKLSLLNGLLNKVTAVAKVLKGVFLFLLLFTFQNSFSQTYPITSSFQIIPPYNVYLPDYCVPGSDKIRVILLQNDLTVPSYEVRLRMTIEWNGSVIMRTSPNFSPRPITLSAGVPNLVSGDDLCVYFATDAIDFTGYNRENYERTKTLPEGAYRISFTAYDYRRQNVQVSNVGSNIFFLQKKDPPLLNSPSCSFRIPKIDPQFITFNWSSVNTPSLPGNETEYTFSLYEIKPKNSDPNFIIRSSAPIYTTVTRNNILSYGPGEPALLDDMEYVWIVQARSSDGRDLYANQGNSRPCKFSYGGVDPFHNLPRPTVFAQPLHERAAKVWWPPAQQQNIVEGYQIEYRGSTNSSGEFPWHTEEKERDETTLTISSLEPEREYEVRASWKVNGVYGPYSEVVKFTTPKPRKFECGEDTAPTVFTNQTPLQSAEVGLIVKIGSLNITLLEVSGSNGTFSGKGKIANIGFLHGLRMNFSNIFINTDLVVTRGEMQADAEPIEAYVGEKVEKQRKVDAYKKFDGKIPDANTPIPELQEFAKALIEIPQDRIDKAIALTRAEKQQIETAREKAKVALKTLNDPQATAQEKTEAERNLRKAVADAKPALDKLANTLDRGIQTVVGRWFKKVMDFLNAYKGDEADKKQAIVWHNKMDSTVNVLSNRKEVPATLKKAMVDAHQNAGTAWANLEKGTDGIRPRGPNADFEEGYTPEDIVLCKENAKKVEAVENYIRALAEKGIVNNEAGNYMTPDKRLVNLPAKAEIFYNCENENKFQNTGYLYKFRADNKIWQAVGTERLGSGFQFEKYACGGEQYTIGILAKEGDEVWQVTQTLVQNQRTLSIRKMKLSNTTAYSNIFEKSAELSEEKRMPVTTKCDNNPNSNTASNTTTIPEPNGGVRYDVKVYLEDGKWKAQVTLKRNPKHKTPAQKAAIEAEMNKEIAEKLNELEGLNGKRSATVTAQPTEDSGEFWVKDMNGLEWLHTIADLGGSVWETSALPKKYWDKDEGYQNSTVHMPPTFAGVSDGAVDKITEFPQLVKLAYDVATKAEVRTGLWNSVMNISPESIKKVFENFYEEKKANYTSNKTYTVRHTLGKDVVTIAFGALGGLTLLKDAVETTGQTIKKAIQKKLDEVTKFMKTPDFRKILDNAWGKYKGKLSKEKWEEKYKTLYKNREKGAITESKFKELMDGEPESFIVNGELRKVDNLVGNTAREIKSGKLRRGEFSETQLKKDIEMLVDPKIPVKKIEWHLFGGADDSMIQILEKLKITYGPEKFNYILY